MAYTTVTARIIDQALTITNAPRIASGGDNVTRITMTFDPTWTGYGKTAVFYVVGDENRVYHTAVSQDAVTLPHEVMLEAGRVSFAVRGVSGNAVRTTNVVYLTIEEGAKPGVNPLEPLPDYYLQVTSAYGQMEQDLAVERGRIDELATLEEGSTTGDAELTDIRVDVNGTTHTNAGTAVRYETNLAVKGTKRRLDERISQIGTPSVNLYDVTTSPATTQGTALIASSASINDPISMAAYPAIYSVVFPCVPKTQYTVTHAFHDVVYYGADGNRIGYETTPIAAGTATTTITTQANAYYVSFSFLATEITTGAIMICEGTTVPSTYTAHLLTPKSMTDAQRLAWLAALGCTVDDDGHVIWTAQS